MISLVFKMSFQKFKLNHCEVRLAFMFNVPPISGFITRYMEFLGRGMVKLCIYKALKSTLPCLHIGDCQTQNHII